MVSRIIMLTAIVAGLSAGFVSAEEFNQVVGKVGDFVMRETDLDRLISYQAAETQQKFQEEPERRVVMVRQLLMKKAIAAKARKEGFDRKPATREQLGFVVDDFLAQEYLLKVVVANVKVPEEDMRKFFKEKEQDFALPEQVKVRHIFIEAPKDAAAEVRDKAKAKAEGLLQRLQKGEDFAKLAQEASDDQDTGKNGGELGFVSPGKTSSEEFEKAAFALKSGESSGVVETQYGYHIIKVDERKEKRTASFDEAKEFIRKKLQGEFEQKTAQEFVDQAMKDGGIEIFEERITGKKKEEAAKPEALKEEAKKGEPKK